MTDPYKPKPYVQLSTPEWVRDAVIYEINLRQFTPQGNLQAALTHLPRLQALGVDILWLMPIHPIGEKNRKGSLGSPYSVKDYYGVNAEFGSLGDLQAFVQAAHAQGMKVILDWVANHSAWDNELVASHPHWYARDYKGDFRPSPWWDWTDIIDFDYQQPGLRRYMQDAMVYWVEMADVDGFRCDVAGFVPLDFWESVRSRLDAIKPVFMLAEWEARDLHQRAFDMTYAWSWNEALHGITTQGVPLSRLNKYYAWNQSAFPRQAHRMTFVSNHDKNSWDGTQFEQFGDGLHACIVLSVLGEGMPLIYNGQEAGNLRRLAFFERDPIEWQTHPIGDLYRQLIALKKAHTCLHNGIWGATMIRVPNDHPRQVFSFVRCDMHSKVFVVLNLSGRTVSVSFAESLFQGQYVDPFSEQQVVLENDSQLDLDAWQYRVLICEPPQ